MAANYTKLVKKNQKVSMGECNALFVLPGWYCVVYCVMPFLLFIPLGLLRLFPQILAAYADAKQIATRLLLH